MRRTARCRDEHGRWDTCAGRLDEGVPAEDNMRRELKEELGVTGAVLTFIGYRDVFRMVGADSPHYVGLDFLARVNQEQVSRQEPELHDAGGWFSLEGLPSPLHSQLLFFLEKYQHLLVPITPA